MFSTNMVLKIICILMLLFHRGYSSRCSICEGIVDKFTEGLKKTAKSNFGGGNTHWEEKSLGSYAFSETRLLEILEGVCPSEASKEKECHLMVEEYEENIENWWFKHYAKGKETPLRSYLCVERVRKACCEHGTWGPRCSPCPACYGTAKCKGNGTREGTGKCECPDGYTSELCNECSGNYFTSSESPLTCTKCDDACEDGCEGAGPENCLNCKEGWNEVSDGKGCEDKDECLTFLTESNVCEAGKYCVNTPGSYKCMKCDEACETCKGDGPLNCTDCAAKYYEDSEGKCVRCHRACESACEDGTTATCDACAEGWEFNEDENCVDIDECKTLNDPCKDGTYCGNFPGTYHCLNCNPACAKCFGAGPAHCDECAPGFARDIVGVCKKIEEKTKSEEDLADLNKRVKAATKEDSTFSDITKDDLAEPVDEQIVLQGDTSKDKTKEEL